MPFLCSVMFEASAWDLKTRGMEPSEGLTREEDPLPKEFIHKAGKLVLAIGRRP